MTIPPLAGISPVPLPATKTQLSRLGERLAAGTPGPGDQDRYLAFLDTYDAVQVALVGTLRAVDWPSFLPRLPPLDIVGRTKTLDTLVQKLRRSPGVKLPYVRDVAGVRIVADMTLADQQVIAQVLTEHVASGRIIDRIAEPQSGYRALHAVITVAGLPVEVQIRTRMQHGWAEVFERLADRWGRQIRYGGIPDDPRAPGAIDDGVSVEDRVQLVTRLQELSLGALDRVERALNKAAAHNEAPVDDAERQTKAGMVPPEEAAALREEFERLASPVRRRRRQVEQQLLDLVTPLDEEPPSTSGTDTVEER